MSKKKNNKPAAAPQPARTKRHLPAWITYAVGFALLWAFSAVIYGPVFRHLAEENFFTFESEPMRYVLREPWGWAYWSGRLLLLAFSNRYVGGTLLALLLTLVAWLFDAGLRRWQLWRGIGFIVPIAYFALVASRGLNISLRVEPSLPIVAAVALLLVAAVVAFLHFLLARGRKPAPRGGFPLGLTLTVVAFVSLVAYTLRNNENVILAARMQNSMLEEDWEQMLADGASARRPSRSVAALHAIAALRSGQLMERMFDIDYNFEPIKLDNLGGSDEGANYVTDCNLHAGLVYPAYRSSMELVVTCGPRLCHYKRMAICAILNGEKKLAERYLHLISLMPFQSSFVEKYAPMVDNPELIKEDPTLAGILELAPTENRFEQNYRQPVFLGYNVKMMEGRDAALVTSVAACLYSKDLDNFLMRANYLQTKQTLPPAAQQAVCIAAIKRDGLLKHFPSINPYVNQEVEAFVMDAAPYVKDREEMRKHLRDRWLGTYMYYYYCGNTESQAQSSQSSGVN